MKSSKITLLTGFILLVLFLSLVFCFQVRVTEVAVVTTFGKYSRSLPEPGIYFRAPLPIQKVYKFDKRLQNFERKFETTLTKDGKNLLSTIFIGWRIADPKPFLELFNGNVTRAEDSLEGIVRNAKMGVIGQYNFGDLISPNPQDVKFADIESEMLKIIQAEARAKYGIQVELLGIKQLGLPESITAEVFKRMKAERDRMVKKFAGEGAREAKTIKSNADLESEKLKAEARGTAAAIESEANKAADEDYRVLQQDPELAKFLLEQRAMEEAFKERLEIIMDPKNMDLLKGLQPSAPKR